MEGTHYMIQTYDLNENQASQEGTRSAAPIPTRFKDKYFDAIVMRTTAFKQVGIESLSYWLNPEGILLIESNTMSIQRDLLSVGDPFELCGVIGMTEESQSHLNYWKPMLAFRRADAQLGIHLPNHIMARKSFLVDFVKATFTAGSVLLIETTLDATDSRDGVVISKY
jgi:hypothetical protein